MVWTKEMCENQKKISDFKKGDVVWKTKYDGNGHQFEQIIIGGPSCIKGYTEFYTSEGSSKIASNNTACWDFDPGCSNHSQRNPRLENLTTEDLLNIFWFFDKHGLIDPNLSFDPEHFMETVAKKELPSFNYKRQQK